jgi:hypothetical protein
MDPITTVIVAALSQLAVDVIKDAYTNLKKVLVKKFGGDSDLVKAVDDLEKKPESEGRKSTLAEEIVAAKAEQDSDIADAVASLSALLKIQQGNQAQVNVQISGGKVQGIAGASNAQIGNMEFNDKTEK